jgi:hypothetical protein
MVIQDLKQETEVLLQSLEKEGKSFQFVALIPAYPGFSGTSYILQLAADWLDKHSCTDSVNYVIDKMYQTFSRPALEYINRIDLYDEQGNLHCGSEEFILRNEIGYRPESFA